MASKYITFTPHPGYNDAAILAARPPEIEMIRNSIREGMERNPSSGSRPADPGYDCADDLFVIKRAGEWISANKGVKKPDMLFGNFWFENELCILFADTNVGKSILAVQLGNCIACGSNIEGFETQLPASPVLYFDFEQSSAQFEARYMDLDGAFKFSPDFYRAELNAAAGDVRNYLDRIHACIEEGIRKTKARVLIVDNLTYLANEAQRSRDALVMMKFLKMLKSKYHISILALAHTPKRNPAKPITNNDMQGSKMLINFCDSAFAMGRSQRNAAIRYLKQIKQRNATEMWGEERVCLFMIERSGANLRLAPCGHDHEQEHLQKANYISLPVRRKVITLFKGGTSKRQIGLELGIARSSVSRILDEEE